MAIWFTPFPAPRKTAPRNLYDVMHWDSKSGAMKLEDELPFGAYTSGAKGQSEGNAVTFHFNWSVTHLELRHDGCKGFWKSESKFPSSIISKYFTYLMCLSKEPKKHTRHFCFFCLPISQFPLVLSCDGFVLCFCTACWSLGRRHFLITVNVRISFRMLYCLKRCYTRYIYTYTCLYVSMYA